MKEAHKSIEALEITHKWMGEELELLKNVLSTQSCEEEEKLKKDKVKERFMSVKAVDLQIAKNTYMDLDDLFRGQIPHRLYPLGPDEGGSDLNKLVRVSSCRQLLFFNALYDKVLLFGERVFCVPNVTMRIISELINCPNLALQVGVKLDKQWSTSLNHIFNSLFGLGHPPGPEAIITRHKFHGKTILWYRFTDCFLNELNKQNSVLGFRVALKKFGVIINKDFMCKGFGLAPEPTHRLLRVD